MPNAMRMCVLIFLCVAGSAVAAGVPTVPLDGSAAATIIAMPTQRSDAAGRSPDGARRATVDLDNASGLDIVDLDPKSPTPDLRCDASNGHLEFKGWRDGNTVDFALVSHGARNRLAQATAVRLAKSFNGWQIQTANADRLAAIGFACRQAKP